MKINKDQLEHIWFTADTHFGHNNILKMAERPWACATFLENQEKLSRKPLPNNAGDLFLANREYAVSTEEVVAHNMALIENWNRHVKPSDTVFHLGDFCFGNGSDASNYLDMLNGKIHIIWGNHDDPAKKVKHRFTSYQDILELKIEDPIEVSHLHPQRPGDRRKIVLCHYPMRSWNGSYHGSWHLYGHCHNGIPTFKGSFDVGVDSVARILTNKSMPEAYVPFRCHYRPLSYFEVRDYIFEITCGAF